MYKRYLIELIIIFDFVAYAYESGIEKQAQEQSRILVF